MIDFEKLSEIMQSSGSFLLTTHVNPDADAIGSEIALYHVLRELNKKVHIINHSDTPYNLKYLDKENKIEQFNKAKHLNIFNEVDVLIALDFNRHDRMASMQAGFTGSSKMKICIDHHQDPTDFADHFFIDVNYSATGQIIYDLIKKTGIVNLKYETAYPIYTAIMTDTGSFRFERTTPEIHRIAAELLEFNIIPGEVFDKIYDQSKFGKIKLLGSALHSMKLYGKGKQIAYMVLTKDLFKEVDIPESDTDGFVNFSLSVKNVKIGLLFIELNDGIKISFRSKGNIPVNRLAAAFGGGGHINAAGARIRSGNLDEYISHVLKKAEGFLH